MFPRRLWLVNLLLLASLGLSAQRISLSGTVRDTLQQPLDMANVVAINQADQTLEGFGISNPQGEYRLNLKTNSNYLLKISYLGFEPAEVAIQTAEQDLILDVTLKAQSEKLDEVEVVYEIPITIKGDTLVYNTDSFVSGTEKKLADVLQKLPGIEVNDDGEIEVEGKRVTKVMVEGEDFFDGDSKLASKNIPAKALDKVEVLRNYSEVSQLSSVTNNQENVAINIKLKEGKKKFWFGDFSAGAGPENRYVVHPKLFYYSPQYSINILTNLNNTGEIPFSGRDYWSFTGGMRGATRGSTGTQFVTGPSGLGLSMMQNNRAKNILTQFGAVNMSYQPVSTWRLSGFGIYSQTNTLMETVASRTFISSNETEKTNSKSDQNTRLGLVKLTSNFKPSDRLQWNYDGLLRLNEELEDSRTISVAAATDTILEYQKQRPHQITQNSNLYYTLNDSHIFALETQYDYSDENPFYKAIRDLQPFVGIVPSDPSQNGFDLSQKQYTQTNRVDAKLDYFWVINPKSHLNFTLGTIQSSQRFNSAIFQTLDSGNILAFSESELGNQVQFYFSDLWVGMHVKWISGAFTFNPGFHVHQYMTRNEQLESVVSKPLTNVVPDAFVNWQMKRSQSLRLNYSVDRNFTDINNLARGYVFSNYNAIYAGNRELESALYHQLSLNFSSFNMFSMQNIFANVAYFKRIDAFKSSAGISGINQISTTINSGLEDETLNGSGNFQRTFGRVKVSSTANLSYSNTNNIVNQQPQNSRSFTQNYSVSVGSSFTKAPNLEMGYRYTVNQYQTGVTNTSFLTDRPFLKFDAAFLDGFILLADYDFYHYRDREQTVQNKYGFLNASLSYQKADSKWEYSIEATNLTNNNVLNQDNYSDLFFRTSAYAVQPSVFVFKIKYEL
jgi:hypothetical protein